MWLLHFTLFFAFNLVTFHLHLALPITDLPSLRANAIFRTSPFSSSSGLYTPIILSEANIHLSINNTSILSLPKSISLRLESDAKNDVPISSMELVLKRSSVINTLLPDVVLSFQRNLFSDCHYAGHIKDNPSSMASFNLCGDTVSGYVFLHPNRLFKVEPTLAQGQGSKVRLIGTIASPFTSTSLKKRQLLSIPLTSIKTIYLLLSYHYPNGTSRQDAYESTLKLLEKAQTLLSSQNLSNIRLVLKRIVDLPSETFPNEVVQNSTVFLQTWCEFWQSRYSGSTDVGYLITLDPLYSNALSPPCHQTAGVACGIFPNSKDPNLLASLFLHSLGHTLGMTHDTEECGTDKLMHFPALSKATQYSKCSLDQFQQYLDTHDVQSLVKMDVNRELNYTFYNSKLEEVFLYTKSVSMFTLTSTPTPTPTPTAIPTSTSSFTRTSVSAIASTPLTTPIPTATTTPSTGSTSTSPMVTDSSRPMISSLISSVLYSAFSTASTPMPRVTTSPPRPTVPPVSPPILPSVPSSPSFVPVDMSSQIASSLSPSAAQVPPPMAVPPNFMNAPAAFPPPSAPGSPFPAPMVNPAFFPSNVPAQVLLPQQERPQRRRSSRGGLLGGLFKLFGGGDDEE